MYGIIQLVKKLIDFKTICGLSQESIARPYSLIVDASTGTGNVNDGLGAMLCQTDEEGEERVKVKKE